MFLFHIIVSFIFLFIFLSHFWFDTCKIIFYDERDLSNIGRLWDLNFVRSVLMKDYIASVPLIDTHMHRISYQREPDFGQIAGGSLAGPGQEKHARQRLLFHVWIDQLKERFSMPPSATPEEVERERQRRVQADPIGYYRSCFTDANVSMYCIETGSPLRDKPFSQEEVDFFDSCIPDRQKSYIVRIERIFDELLEEHYPFPVFEQKAYDKLHEQVDKQHAVALKSAIAYYSGLNFSPTSRETAIACYEKMRLGIQTSADEAAFYNYTLMIGVDIAAEYGIPLQIHTGPGNSIYFNHRYFSPAALLEFLRDKRVLNRISVVLLHAGHPYEEETGFLVSQYQNVYTDLSQTFLFSSLIAEEKIRALLEYAPLDKIMYGSDGVLFPEMYWYAPWKFRRLFADVLENLQTEHYIGKGQAKDIAKMVMYENALACYTKLQSRL